MDGCDVWSAACKSNSGQFDDQLSQSFIFSELREKAKLSGGGIMIIVSTNNYSPYGVACIRCNHSLIAPDWSKYVSERHVSHAWCCDGCGHRFETSHHLHFNAQPSEPLFG
jgi:hypothetical protein